MTATTEAPAKPAPAKAKLRARLVDLSVVAGSALVLAGALLVVAQVDASSARLTLAAAAPPAPLPEAPYVARAASPTSRLIPAPRAKQRVVVVRRSRAS